MSEPTYSESNMEIARAQLGDRVLLIAVAICALAAMIRGFQAHVAKEIPGISLSSPPKWGA
jgi:hypothetical protein